MVLQFTNSEPNSSVFYTEQLNRLRILGTKLLPLGKGRNRHGTGDLEWTLRSGVGTGSVTVKSRRFMYIVCADMCIDTVWIDCIGLWIVSIYIYGPTPTCTHVYVHMYTSVTREIQIVCVCVWLRIISPQLCPLRVPRSNRHSQHPISVAQDDPGASLCWRGALREWWGRGGDVSEGWRPLARYGTMWT